MRCRISDGSGGKFASTQIFARCARINDNQRDTQSWGAFIKNQQTAKKYKKGVPICTGVCRESIPAGALPVPIKCKVILNCQKIETPDIVDVNNPSYGRWTEDEKRLFNEAMTIYGKGRWKLVAQHVCTR